MILSNPTVSIIIPHWNGIEVLSECLASIKKSKFSSYEIIVSDNMSTDGSQDWIKKNYPDIQLVENDKNYGFSGGCNRGAEAADGDYLLFLNNDTIHDENWIGPLVDKIKSDSTIGAVQPKILNYYNRSIFDYAGGSGGHMDIFCYPFARGRVFLNQEEDMGQYNNSEKCFWASGTALLIKRELFFGCGKFDELFFAHMEEIDLCWRINNLNLKVYCEPKSKIYHLGSQTLRESDPKKTYLNFRNNLIMILKNDLFINLLWKLPLRFILDFFAFLRLLIKKKSRYHSISVLKAYKDFILDIKLNFSKRNKNNGEPSIMYKNIIPMKYYLQKIKKYTDL